MTSLIITSFNEKVYHMQNWNNIFAVYASMIKLCVNAIRVFRTHQTMIRIPNCGGFFGRTLRRRRFHCQWSFGRFGHLIFRNVIQQSRFNPRSVNIQSGRFHLTESDQACLAKV